MEKFQPEESLPVMAKKKKKCQLKCSISPVTIIVAVPVLAIVFLLIYRISTNFNPPAINTVCETGNCYKLSDRINSTIKWTADPCADFYEFACGNWEDVNPGYDSETRKNKVKIDKILQNLLDEENGSTKIERKAQIYYKSCLTAQFRRSVEIESFWAFLKLKFGEEWTQWPNTVVFYSDLDMNCAQFYSKVQNQVQYPVDIFKLVREIDMYNSSRNIFRLVPNFLTFPEIVEKYCVNGKGNRYNIHTDIHLELHSISNYQYIDVDKIDPQVKGTIKNVADFENELIDVFFGPNLTNFESYKTAMDDTKSYNLTSLDELQEMANFVNWTDYFTQEFSKVNESIPQNFTILLNGYEYFEKFSQMVNSTQYFRSFRQQFFNYLILRLAKLFKNSNSFCPGTSATSINTTDTDIVEQLDSNYEKFDQNCKDTCLSVLKSSTTLSPAIASLYIRSNFMEESSSEIRNNTEKMFDNIRTTYVQEMDYGMYDAFIDGPALQDIKLKANNTAPVIGYQDYLLKLQDIDADLIPDDFFENTIKLYREDSKIKFGGFSKIVERFQFGEEAYRTTPFFSQQRNLEVVPAATLDSKLFNLDFPLAFLYGRVGGSIARELLLGFDLQGRQFDKDGNYVEDWTKLKEYKRKFENRLDCFKKQYPLLNDNWLDKIVSDNGGLQIAYKAFKTAERGLSENFLLPDLNLTPDQLFFISSAQGLCEKFPEIGTRTYPGNKYRVNVPLENYQRFAEAFECKTEPYYTPNYGKLCNIW